MKYTKILFNLIVFTFLCVYLWLRFIRRRAVGPVEFIYSPWLAFCYTLSICLFLALLITNVILPAYRKWRPRDKNKNIWYKTLIQKFSKTKIFKILDKIYPVIAKFFTQLGEETWLFCTSNKYWEKFYHFSYAAHDSRALDIFCLL